MKIGSSNAEKNPEIFEKYSSSPHLQHVSIFPAVEPALLQAIETDGIKLILQDQFVWSPLTCSMQAVLIKQNTNGSEGANTNVSIE